MKIKQDLPQFKDAHVLLVVAGDQSGVLYHAHNGKIEKLEESKVPLQRYSDHEGSFKRRIRHGFLKFSTLSGGGAPYEKKEEKAQTVFLREFTENIKHAVADHEISSFYLYAPDYFEAKIKDAIGSANITAIKKVFNGTYIKEHPFTLLKKIRAYNEEVVDMVEEPMSADAQKLLKKAGLAKSKKFSGKRERQVHKFITRDREA